ncbi:MAG: methyl-accepting chemotaxis protein [Pseudomonadota bacterium]
MSITKRLYLAMAALITLIAAVGVIAAFQTNRLVSAFDSFQDTVATSALTQKMMEDVMEARLAAFEYQNGADPADREQVLQNIAAVRSQEATLVEAFEGIPEQALVVGLSDTMVDFETALTAGSAQNQEIKKMVSEALGVREEARKQIAELADSLFNDINFTAGRQTNDALLRLLHARSMFDQVLLTGDTTMRMLSSALLQNARSDVEGLLENLVQTRQRTLAEGAIASIDEIVRREEAIMTTVGQRDAQYALLDELGPATLARITETSSVIDARRTALAGDVRAISEGSIVKIVGFVAVGAVLGIIVALVVGRIISRGLARLTNMMTDVAGGDLDIDIETSEATHEMAKMNNSLVVFIENARRTRELSAQMADAEELEKERAAAERDRAARQVAEAKAERERADVAEAERARMRTLEAFQADMEDVIGKAAAGSLSNRLGTDMPDERLVGLAQSVNNLLQSVEENISQLIENTSALADGQLDTRIGGAPEGDFLRLKNDFNASLEKLAGSMQDITQSGFKVSSSSSELEQAANGMAKRAESNAASVEQTSAAVEELTISVKQMVENTRVADSATKRAKDSALATSEVSQQTETSIGALSEASAQINRVVQVIEDIAFQINLLALNAGVEAARAGEAGRGFSVVASEVRALAQRSQDAVREISDVIVENNKVVEESVRQVGLSRSKTETIVSEIEIASGQISEIAQAVEQQSHGLDDINTAVQSIGSNAQTTAAVSEEITAATVTLSREADTLAETLRGFKGVDSAGIDHAAHKIAAE